jgi:uncharacterized protein
MPRVPTLVPLLLLLAALLLAAPIAQSASPNIVVSQVYGGGGNAGASFTNDFVELFNRGSSAVDVSGWTIQYASASGTSWQATPLSGTIQPGKYYLVQLASAAAVGAPLPTPDATGTTNLANSGGKVAVVRDASLLTCGGAPGSCSANTQVADLIGWGSAADYEGTGAAAALANATADARAASGCTDTDDSAADFDGATPAPRNSSLQAASCGAPPPPPPSSGMSQNAAVDIEVGPVLSIALERAAISFGNAAVGDTPPRVSEQVTVVSNSASGYALSAHRSAFSPADLPLGVAASAPTGGTLGGSLGGGAMAAIPIPPTPDLLIGTMASGSAVTGDIWPTHVGFVSRIPNVASGRYTATVTFTVIGR